MRLSYVSALKVFSSDSCSKSASNCKLCFCMSRPSLPAPISLKPPPWKTESFTGSVGITFSCGMPRRKNKWFLIWSLPSILLSYCPLLPFFHYPLRSCCTAGWLHLQHLHLVPPSILRLASINCSSDLIILICNHFALLAYGSAQTKHSLSF